MTVKAVALPIWKYTTPTGIMIGMTPWSSFMNSMRADTTGARALAAYVIKKQTKAFRATTHHPFGENMVAARAARHASPIDYVDQVTPRSLPAADNNPSLSTWMYPQV